MIRAYTILAAVILSGHAAQAQEHRVDPDTGIETWETTAHGVTLSLTQILPDQARAFYINRGFTAEAAEIYATSCVYMTVLRNDTAPGVVSFRLADWSVVTGDKRQPPVSFTYRTRASGAEPVPTTQCRGEPSAVR